MAKKDHEPWQPMLLDLTPRKEAEPRVEYDEPAVRVRKKQVIPTADGGSDEAPWWNRARQAEQKTTQQQTAGKAPPEQSSWGAEWHRLLRFEGWTAELPQGKRTELERAVRSLDVRSGVIEATVGVGSTRPDRVQIRAVPVGLAEWTRLVRHVIDRRTEAAVVGGLEQGQIPLALVDAADANQTPLLPRRLAFLNAACTCGGAMLPCDHLLSVHLVMARRLYREPQQLLQFRGIGRGELVGLLERVRSEAMAGQPATTTPSTPEDPYRRPPVPEPDWTRLDRAPPGVRQPLPLPEGWRAAETLDAVVRRIVMAAQAAGR
jgi:uncharacterized Zn finger protein